MYNFAAQVLSKKTARQRNAWITRASDISVLSDLINDQNLKRNQIINDQNLKRNQIPGPSQPYDILSLFKHMLSLLMCLLLIIDFLSRWQGVELLDVCPDHNRLHFHRLPRHFHLHSLVRKHSHISIAIWNKKITSISMEV